MVEVLAVASGWKTICAKCREMFLFYKLQGTQIAGICACAVLLSQQCLSL
jgi:hypothetical protein